VYVRDLRRRPGGSTDADGSRLARPWRCEYRDAAGVRHGQRFGTQAEAEAWGADREAEVVGRTQDPRQPFGPYARRWLASRVVETTTEATDRGRMTKHVLPAWQSVPLDGIRASGVQAWVKQLTSSGLAPATVQSRHNLFAGVLEAAVRDGLIGCNPARGVQLPAIPPGREVYLSRAEVDQVAAAMADDSDRAVLLTLAYCGLRWGELAGLCRSRLAPDLSTLRVVETVVEVGGAFSRKPYPKGRRVRTAPIPQRLRGVLDGHLCAHPGGGDLPVFTDGAGEPLSRHQWPRTAFRPAVAAALGRSDIRVHDLRHSYASWLVQAGVGLYQISALLGHTDPATTARYAHLEPDAFGPTLSALDADPDPD
jgi:integrase